MATSRPRRKSAAKTYAEMAEDDPDENEDSDDAIEPPAEEEKSTSKFSATKSDKEQPVVPSTQV